MKIFLPNAFKYVGLAILALLIIGLVTIKLSDPSLLKENELLRDGTLGVMSIGLLVIILSKDKIEDERVVQLRFQAFMLAFLFGVLFTLGYSFHLHEGAELASNGAWLILLMQGIYLSRFNILKFKNR